MKAHGTAESLVQREGQLTQEEEAMGCAEMDTGALLPPAAFARPCCISLREPPPPLV